MQHVSGRGKSCGTHHRRARHGAVRRDPAIAARRILMSGRARSPRLRLTTSRLVLEADTAVAFNPWGLQLELNAERSHWWTTIKHHPHPHTHTGCKPSGPACLYGLRPQTLAYSTGSEAQRGGVFSTPPPSTEEMALLCGLSRHGRPPGVTFFVFVLCLFFVYSVFRHRDFCRTGFCRPRHAVTGSEDDLCIQCMSPTSSNTHTSERVLLGCYVMSSQPGTHFMISEKVQTAGTPPPQSKR